jgi:hypothetical protein
MDQDRKRKIPEVPEEPEELKKPEEPKEKKRKKVKKPPRKQRKQKKQRKPVLYVIIDSSILPNQHIMWPRAISIRLYAFTMLCFLSRAKSIATKIAFCGLESKVEAFAPCKEVLAEAEPGESYKLFESLLNLITQMPFISPKGRHPENVHKAWCATFHDELADIAPTNVLCISANGDIADALKEVAKSHGVILNSVFFFGHPRLPNYTRVLYNVVRDWDKVLKERDVEIGGNDTDDGDDEIFSEIEEDDDEEEEVQVVAPEEPVEPDSRE